MKELFEGVNCKKYFWRLCALNLKLHYRLGKLSSNIPINDKPSTNDAKREYTASWKGLGTDISISVFVIGNNNLNWIDQLEKGEQPSETNLISK